MAGEEGIILYLIKTAFGLAISFAITVGMYWAMQGEPDFITNLKQKAPAMVQTVTTLSEQDHSQGAIGLTSSIDRMKNADWLRATHGGTYKRIKNLPWIKDGLTADEAKTAQDLLYMSVNDHETLKRTLTLQWIEDQITPSEAKAIRWLKYLSSRNDEAARKIAKMPFLESVTEKDALLIEGLHARSHRGYTRRIHETPNSR